MKPLVGPGRTLAAAACLVAALGAARADGESAGPQTAPQAEPQTEPQTAPQTRPRTRREMQEMMRAMAADPERQQVRYEKGSFMITGSIEIDPTVYDGKPVVQDWIRRIESLWKPKIPLAAQIGNSGRVTFKGVLVRDKGIVNLEKIEPSGLDSLDEAAAKAMEEFRSSFEMPPGFPADYIVFYLKFHYNIHSKI